MTIIEYYSEIALENAASTLAYRAKETILIYDKKILSPQISAHAACLEKLFCKKIPGYRKLHLLPVDACDIFGNADLIVSIAQNKEECIFDLTGGAEPIMVSMGMAAEKLGNHRIHMHQFLLREGKSVCCHRSLPSHEAMPVQIPVDELIALHGGTCHCGIADDTPSFSKLVEALWDISRSDPTNWNKCLFLLNSSRGNNGKNKPALFAGNISDVTEKNHVCKEIIIRLISADVLSSRGNQLFFSDHETMNCFLKNGTVFELTARKAVVDLLRRNGQYFPGAVEFEALIEWQNSAVKNEVDVIFMNGLIPVFISCKNGAVDDEELYKFKTVSEQFGGEKGIKILLVSPDALGDNTQAFIARARHMGIRVIHNVGSMSIGKLSYEIAHQVELAMNRI
ncbi:MAG: DUF1887 family protein [Ruminococcaceae bacterium]|nr:DUF1887 family protein [Oscillospiraceae bacterium]